MDCLVCEVYLMWSLLCWSSGHCPGIRSVHLVCAHAVSTIKRFVADLTFPVR